MGDRRDRRNGAEQSDEKINPWLVVDTGFTAPSSSGNVCFEFQRSGSCSKGAACRFAHGSDVSGPVQGGSVQQPSRPGDAKPWLSSSATVIRCADGSIQLAEPEPGALTKAHQRDGERHDKKHKKSKDRDRDRKEEKHRKHHHHKEKSHKKHKKRSRSRSRSRSESSSSEEAAVVPVPTSVPQLTDDDYFLRNHEFSSWLRSSKGVFFTDLSAAEARRLFGVFAAAWNARQLPGKLYSGITVTGRR
jgi:hypothetical protein